MSQITALAEKIEHHMAQGHCCSEAMVVAILQLYSYRDDMSLVRLAGRYCGRMEGKYGRCGFITGTILSLAYLQIVERAQIESELCAAFVDNMGTTACREILANKPRYISKRGYCGAIGKFSGEVLEQVFARCNLQPRGN